MKKILLLVLLISVSTVYYSCKGKKKVSRVAKGDRNYGGTFRLSETEPYQTLFPLSIYDAVSAHIATQMYEGLIKFNPADLLIIPSLAEKWDIDTSGRVYTFYLKKGVRFHDDPCFPDGKGREVKASDFKYSFELICTQSPDNNSFAGTFKDKILGANKYFEASSTGKPDFEVEGIKILDDYTLQLLLEKPTSSFLYTLASTTLSVVPKEAVEKYGKESKVGTGPFIFTEEKHSPASVILVSNKNYHAIDKFGNQLPYLDSVIFLFYTSQQKELEEFRKGNLDMLYRLPAESVKDVVEKEITSFQGKNAKYILERSPEMATQFYELVTTKGVFKNKKVRLAFSYAIDREKILDNVLNGEGYGLGINGLSPPAFKDYDISKIKGYGLDVEKARKLLSEAGYPDGKGFPKITLELNSGGNRHINVAEEVQKQLKENLNIDIDLNIVPFGQKLEDSKYARADMFRSSWIADYPSPENFLTLLYGNLVPASIKEPSFPNVARYKNPEFDKLYEQGMMAKSREESYKYFMEAEQLAMHDAPLLILWYDENFRLLQSRVRNFPNNGMQYRDLSIVYFSSEPSSKKKE